MLTQQVSELQAALVQLATHSAVGISSATTPAEPPAAVSSPAADVISTLLSEPAAAPAAPAAAPEIAQTPLEVPEQLGADFAGSAAGLAQSPAAGGSSDSPQPTAPAPGPPPKLVKGMDDIFWVHQLQTGLLNHGFNVDDEEVEDWIFGEGTESALLTFQVKASSSVLSSSHSASRSKALKGGSAYARVWVHMQNIFSCLKIAASQEII